MKKNLYIPILFILCCAESLFAQQDCSTAIPVCQSTYFEANSYNAVGSAQELSPANSSCLSLGEENSVWYIFTVTVSGALEFEITPNNINDDYDWAIYDLTGSDCSGIVTGAAPEVRCNYSAIPGNTGMANPYTLTSVSAGGPNQCAPLNVVVGETYVLIINNHAGSPDGYTLSFGGTAVIYDNLPPEPVSIDPFPCTPPSILHFTLSEYVRCNSIAANGSDFYITGPSTVTVLGASSTNCTSGLFTDNVDIQLSAPISVNGDYELHFKDGTDGNVILDNCGNELSDTAKVAFRVAIADAEFTFEIIKTCQGDSLVFTDLSIGDTTITWDWDFGDGITSTDINPTHNYPSTGSYPVILSITDTGGCFNKDTIIINTYVEAPVAGFSVSPAPYCTNVPVSFFNSSTGQGLNFEWHFGSNGTSTLYEPDFTFLTSGIYTVTLIAVDSIGCKDSVDANLVINPGVIASFLYDPPVVCTGDNVEFSNISTGNPNSIFWDFGNGTTDTSSNINNIVYNQSGTYQVTLIITDAVCLPDTFTQSIKVSDYPIVNLGPDTGICIGESYTLYAGNPGMVYNWSTGETSQSIIVKEVPKVVVLYVSNNGCIGKDTVLVENDCPFFIPNAFTPNGDGLNDIYNIITDGTTEFRLNIFNRWGQQLFTTNDPTVGWDGTFEGTPEEMGVFIYSLELIFKNGVSRISRGNITLIR